MSLTTIFLICKAVGAASRRTVKTEYRRDAQHVYLEAWQRNDTTDGNLSNSAGKGPLLPWVESFPKFRELDGKLGIQLEVTLTTANFVEWSKMAALNFLEKDFGTISKGIAAELDEQGIAAEIITNECKCFLKNEKDKTQTLPFLILISGISEYASFGKSQLTEITNALFDQLENGVKPPPGATFPRVLDADGKPAMTLKEELEQNPQLKGAVRTVRLERFPSNGTFHGLPFSDYQFLLEIELFKHGLITQAVGSYVVAGLAGKMGAGKSESITETVYSNFAGQLVAAVKENGINILVSTPRFASEHFRNIPPLGLEAAEAAHAGDPLRSVIARPKEHAFKQDPDTVWKRKEGTKSIVGFRVVITVTSVNQKFPSTNLPALRNGVADVLSEALPQELRKNGFQPKVDVTPCGFLPNRKEEAPFPHDATACGMPPNWIETTHL